MFEIRKTGEMIITRGDSAPVECEIIDLISETEYVMQDGDILEFTVKESPEDEEALIYKEIVNGTFEIYPEDTNNLKYGKYVYDVQLTTANKKVFTVITKKNFIVTDEVTW